MAPPRNRRPGFSRRAHYGLFIGYVVALVTRGLNPLWPAAAALLGSALVPFDEYRLGRMLFLVAAFWLSRRADWSWTFTFVVLAAGLIPLLIFYVERVVRQKITAENADELEPTTA